MADHLSRLENLNLEELRDEDIDDNFPDEILINVSSNAEDEISCEEIHLMCEKGKMKAIPFVAPFLKDYCKTMPWVTEKPFIYSLVNTCNEAKLYDLDETGKGVVKGNFLFVKEDLNEEFTLGEE
nr:hypothetical protein [Tanacetum cinerariifolium]GFA07376.1 hypothetical protein [Tanacetum cinerariifolium]